MLSRKLLPAVLGATMLLGTAPASLAAEGYPPEEQLFYQNLTVLRYNALGLQNAFDIAYRRQLYDPGDSQVLANNYLGFGLAPVLTPAGNRLGAFVDFRPLNILKLEARFEYIHFYGNFDLLQSFESVDADFSDTAIDAGGEADANYATDGWQLTLDAELRGKIGPVIVRSRFKAAYTEMALEGGDPVWYDQYYDLLLPAAGWFFMNDADVLIEVNEKLIVGVRHSFASVAHADAAFPGRQSGETRATPTHRLGPIAAYTFFDEPGAAFNRPTVLLLLAWYLKHPWRAGEDVSQGVPYVVLGFAFNGDLL